MPALCFANTSAPFETVTSAEPPSKLPASMATLPLVSEAWTEPPVTSTSTDAVLMGSGDSALSSFRHLPMKAAMPFPSLPRTSPAECVTETAPSPCVFRAKMPWLSPMTSAPFTIVMAPASPSSA